MFDPISTVRSSGTCQNLRPVPLEANSARSSSRRQMRRGAQAPRFPAELPPAVRKIRRTLSLPVRSIAFKARGSFGAIQSWESSSTTASTCVPEGSRNSRIGVD